MNSEKFSQSLHIPKEFLLQKNSSIKKYTITTSILVQFQKKYIFLKWKWKTGLIGRIACPKFEKKFECERTANFCFCPSIVSHNLGRKNQMIREISSHCDKNSAHNIWANTDEYPYHAFYSYILGIVSHDFMTKTMTI